ncbi:MAG TPA: cytochrome c oxidase subunit 3 [Bryobacteraceae bacterium]|jgi:heme/copper-type cytochrome/quinol oxidase subunit 3|nr:cytochrome c oxidase subunit 3 [Bryobacteraceae bacterium]
MRQRARLGMAMFLLSEAVFFFMLIAAFVYFRTQSLAAARVNLSLGAAAVFTACLLASSFTMWRAAVTGLRGWLAGTIGLGGVFLFGQAREYQRLSIADAGWTFYTPYQTTYSPTKSLFGTTFLTLTGLHALHVLVGIVMLAILLGLASSRRSGRRHTVVVETVALYWYFVDIVWVAIFAIVYLWTSL